MTTQEIYEKFKHMEPLILDERFHDDPTMRLLAELWRAVFVDGEGM